MPEQLETGQLAGVLATFTVALMHTLIPSHWLCFVLVARANRWRLGQTLIVTLSAGLVHSGFTVALGIAAAVTGARIHDEHVHRVSAGVLVVLGLLYMVLHLLHAGHKHEVDQKLAERTSIFSLMLSVTFSPCTVVIPVFFGVAARDVAFFVLLSVVLIGTTVGVMSLMVTLSYFGVERLKFSFVDKYEKLIIGVILALMGASLLLFH